MRLLVITLTVLSHIFKRCHRRRTCVEVSRRGPQESGVRFERRIESQWFNGVNVAMYLSFVDLKNVSLNNGEPDPHILSLFQRIDAVLRFVLRRDLLGASPLERNDGKRNSVDVHIFRLEQILLLLFIPFRMIIHTAQSTSYDLFAE